MAAIIKFESSGAATLQAILEWFRDCFKDNTQIYDQTTKALDDYRAVLRQLRDPKQNPTNEDIEKHFEQLKEVMRALTTDINTLHIFNAWANVNLRSDPSFPESLNADSFKSRIQEYIQKDVKNALTEMGKEVARSARRVKSASLKETEGSTYPAEPPKHGLSS